MSPLLHQHLGPEEHVDSAVAGLVGTGSELNYNEVSHPQLLREGGCMNVIGMMAVSPAGQASSVQSLRRRCALILQVVANRQC